MTDHIVAYQPAQNLALASALISLEEHFERAAQQNLELVLQGGGDYTDTEKRSMVKIEQLKLVNGMDLAALLLRGKLLAEIRDMGWWSIHPNGYPTLEAMANEIGITTSELKDIETLTTVIFPYLENTVGIQVAQIWEEIGKSNFRELCPVLNAIITGEQSPSPRVNETVGRVLDDVAATAQAAGQELAGGELQQTAVQNLLEVGRLSNREMRHHIRPERTPVIEAISLQNNGTRLLIAQLTEEQEQMLNRKMGASIETRLITEDQMHNRRALRSIRPIRLLAEMTEEA
jgi:hypothetical protein